MGYKVSSPQRRCGQRPMGAPRSPLLPYGPRGSLAPRCCPLYGADNGVVNKRRWRGPQRRLAGVFRPRVRPFAHRPRRRRPPNGLTDQAQTRRAADTQRMACAGHSPGGRTRTMPTGRYVEGVGGATGTDATGGAPTFGDAIVAFAQDRRSDPFTERYTRSEERRISTWGSFTCPAA